MYIVIASKIVQPTISVCGKFFSIFWLGGLFSLLFLFVTESRKT